MIPTSLIHPAVIESMLEFASSTPQGCFVEVGVYKGGSAIPLATLAKQQGRDFYGYDTFVGIPFCGEFDAHQVGDFADTDYEALCKIMPHGKLVKGLFPVSLLDETKDIAFVHLDVDQYKSYKDSVAALLPRMVPGARFWLDDAGVQHLPGATKACQECFGSSIKVHSCGKWTVTIP